MPPWIWLHFKSTLMHANGTALVYNCMKFAFSPFLYVAQGCRQQAHTGHLKYPCCGTQLNYSPWVWLANWHSWDRWLFNWETAVSCHNAGQMSRISRTNTFKGLDGFKASGAFIYKLIWTSTLFDILQRSQRSVASSTVACCRLATRRRPPPPPPKKKNPKINEWKL